MAVVVAVRRVGNTTVEVQVESAIAITLVRRTRPTIAVIADIVETAIVVAAITRRRIPDGFVRSKLT